MELKNFDMSVVMKASLDENKRVQTVAHLCEEEIQEVSGKNDVVLHNYTL